MITDQWDLFGFDILTFGHLLCIGITSQDPKYDNMSDKLFGLVLWMIPAISILLMVTCYGYSLGWELNMSKYGCVILGVMFMIIGNYLPKCKQNYKLIDRFLQIYYNQGIPIERD